MPTNITIELAPIAWPLRRTRRLWYLCEARSLGQPAPELPAPPSPSPQPSSADAHASTGAATDGDAASSNAAASSDAAAASGAEAAASAAQLGSLWAERPYSFSAATELTLARLAVSLAASHHHAALRARATAPHADTTTPLAAAPAAPHGGGAAPAALHSGAAARAAPHGSGGSGPAARPPALLDPCCGSGTVLYAAALRGLRAVGCDLNPTAVAGARDNLAFAARGAGAALPRGACAPGVHLHDCTLPVHAPRSCVRSRHPR